jgi:FMN-dependent NADH-azoreductase
MANLLHVSSSLFGQNGKSSQIAAEFIEAWRRDHPRAQVVERRLDTQSMPHLSAATLGALASRAEERTDEQHRAVAFADRLIEEVEAADTIVLAVPMYNFTIPSTLKAWIDHIARAGRTFRYTAASPEGLLKGRKVFVVASRGGVYTGESPARALDFQEPYLKSVLAFLGLTDVTFVHVEGLQISPEAAAAGIDRARQAIGGMLPTAAAA